MITIDCGAKHSEKKLVLQYLFEGKIVRYLVPKFDGIECRLNNVYSDEVWKEHGSDRSNYNWQMEEACRVIYGLIENDPSLKPMFTNEDLECLKNGKCPVGYLIHHEYNIGKDLIAVLVKCEEHKKIPHKGASYFANEKNLSKDTAREELSQAKRVFNTISHTMHKNPKATSVVIATGSVAVTYFLTGFVTKSKPKRALFATLFGTMVGLASYYFLTKDDITYC